MKKTWIAYQAAMAGILAVLILLDITINYSGNYRGDVPNTIFNGFAIYIAAFHILVAMPVWLIVLLFNRMKMTRKAFLAGLALFVLFIGMAAWPIVTVIGYTAH